MVWMLRLVGIGTCAAIALVGCGGDPAPVCENGVLDPGEAAIDCGGTCDLCPDGTMCTDASSCASGACTEGACTSPACDDGAQNSDETDVDCGGSCPACPAGQTCSAATDCETGVCTRGQCAEMTCVDGVQNGDETDVDCGGSCPACMPDEGCLAPTDCTSGVCTETRCIAPACDDTVRNGDETDIDCGGSCPACALGQGCAVPSDCVTVACSAAGRCVNGPNPGFEITPESGEAPHSIRVTSTATPGDAPIATIQYDYGAGLEADEVHTFVEPGMVLVRQRVTDSVGAFTETTVAVSIMPPSFTPVRLSESDRTPSPELELSDDRLGIRVLDARAGARTDRSISPGEGIFYAEGQRLSSLLGEQFFGVVTATAPLDQLPGEDDISIGVDTTGTIRFNGSFVESFVADGNDHYGFVVDYRGAQPIVHVIVRANESPSSIVDRVHYSATLETTEPVFFLAGGGRRSLEVQQRIIVGNDLTRFPFRYDAVGLLAAASIDGTGLILGWGQSRTLPANDPPLLEVMPAPMTVPSGTSVAFSAVASDVLDGDLSEEVVWEDLTVPAGERVPEQGSTFTVTPDSAGVFPIRATVVDRVGQRVSQVVDLTVAEAIPSFDPVTLDPDARSGDVTITAGGLGVEFNGPELQGVRANQGLLGDFWYFEATRVGAPGDFGIGVVTKNGALDPYEPATVPPSCSINAVASVFQSLMFVVNYDIPTTVTYGIAVDYRERSPVVYILTNESGGPVLSAVVALDDATLPLHPFAYGQPNAATGADLVLNFGASPFVYAPDAVLSGAGVDVSELGVGWGSANLP